MDRRKFLKGALGTVGFPYIVSSSALGKDGAVAPSQRIVMGCIGMGGQGLYNMRAFMGNDDVEVVAVCDVDKGISRYEGEKERGQKVALKTVEDFYANKNRKIKCACYDDFRELLARSDIDAVSICTPDHWHGSISVAAAKVGKDIYCEKPLTNTIAEGRAVCDAVERYGRVLQTGSHERSNDSVRFAAELIRNGRIGKVHTVRVNMPNNDPHHLKLRKLSGFEPTMDIPEGFDYDRWLGPASWADFTRKRCHFWWRFILSYGGGEMTDRGAHIIDLAQLGLGMDHTGPVEIIAKGKPFGNGIYDTFVEYDFQCRYANGVRLIGSSNAPRGLKFEGTDGWIFIHIHGGRLEAEPQSLLTQKIGPQEIHVGRSPEHHRNFLDAVKSRNKPVATAEIGHRTASICHLVNIAMLTNKKLDWDPVAERITNDENTDRMIRRPMRVEWQV
jgi:predicted dehydrogenase